MKIMPRLKGIALILLFGSLILIPGCRSREAVTRPENAAPVLKIYTTFYPLYDFTRKITGDRAVVENLLPVGVEPHGYEPSPRQMVAIYAGKLCVFLGDPMDP